MPHFYQTRGNYRRSHAPFDSLFPAVIVSNPLAHFGMAAEAGRFFLSFSFSAVRADDLGDGLIIARRQSGTNFETNDEDDHVQLSNYRACAKTTPSTKPRGMPAIFPSHFSVEL